MSWIYSKVAKPKDGFMSGYTYGRTAEVISDACYAEWSMIPVRNKTEHRGYSGRQ